MVLLSDIYDADELDEEPGEVIESAPPQKVGEERHISNSGLKKKLLKRGHGLETPDFNDEVTVHYVGTLLDGTKFYSTRDRDHPLTFTLGQAQVATGLDYGIITMKKGEVSLFTLPAELGVSSNSDSVTQFEVELISWIKVIDVCKDGGVVKKILEKGTRNERPGDLDEVLVNYHVALVDGNVVAETPEGGVQFHVKDGHLFPGLPKVIMSMTRGEKAELLVQPRYAFGEKGREASGGLQSIPPNSVLHVNIELVSFKPVINVTGNSMVLKKILKEGEGAFTANEGAKVTVRYTAMLEDGTVFEKRGIGETPPLEFITDEEQVIAGLDRAVATMKKGERAIISIHPDYAFRNVEVRRDFAIVPPGSNVVYDTEMMDFIKEKAPWELSSNEKIEEAGKKKEEGNFLFKGGKYQRAGRKYEKAADYVSEDGSFADDKEKLAKALRVSCWLNAAACSLKLNDFPGAIKLCSQVLDVEFHNVKALYRRAQAYIETGDLLSADVDIKKALEVDPQNREVKVLQRKCKQLQAENDKKYAKLYGNMFAHERKDSSMVTKRLKVEKEEDERKKEEVMRMEMEKVADSAAPPDGGLF
ncbi:PREDICTED: peptidyl-prolyl cis-trans isomerase FKBP62-like [Lupinus angustifolius]|uniref:peptidyl-prolyl cis-trans isomerase FKBP62-like n=1 Tax=Lupinus angustifolius TaxID=3871 RepID=UPI00092E7E0D|nr:PREDICTED: peptidyl-prolyl cis-trans isomerase FKBP62-like [Lupinus angustifolius]